MNWDWLPWRRPRMCDLPMPERIRARAMMYGAVGGIKPIHGEKVIRVEVEDCCDGQGLKMSTVEGTRGRCSSTPAVMVQGDWVSDFLGIPRLEEVIFGM